MLLNKATLEGIRDGRVSLAFRRWKKPTVRTGGTLKTRLGELEIVSVEPTSLAVDHCGRRARSGTCVEEGTAGPAREARRQPGAHHLRPPPRRSADRPAQRRQALGRRRRRRSGRSSTATTGGSAHGPWTRATLRCLADRPRVSARILSADLGFERLWWKANVRKLKALGLTISHSPGYELSPRGKALLARLGNS